MVKHPPANAGDVVQSLDLKDPLEKEMAAHPNRPGKFHGQRSLTGYSPWDCQESDMTEHAAQKNETTLISLVFKFCVNENLQCLSAGFSF